MDIAVLEVEALFDLMREFWLNCEKCLLNFENFDKVDNEYRYRITNKNI